ncbi:DUF2207 domain-containing protein [Streptobacillus felis]|uniref:DUF2207 domain-containing protein n=1 Tax=Streptobacillus felis TaxID=1384509 RepID=UPI00082D8517|nr:DUF2207 domain-containing protein [Streptobacillus felis]
MKKLVIFFVTLLSIFTFSFEKISNFEMDIKVEQNGVLNVTEKITYITDAEGRRGIYRIIPFKYSNGSYFKFEDRVKIDDFSVRYVDFNNEVGLYTEIEDNVMVYRLGLSDVYLPANKDINYEIKYKVYNSIRSNENINQIYFNALGNYWEMPVENFKLNITGIKGQIDAFTGYVGETNKDYELKEVDGGYEIKTTKVSNPGEGLSFLLNSDSFKYSGFNLWYNRVKAYPLLIVFGIILLPILLINFLIRMVVNKFKYKKTIMVEYMPPNISPLIAKIMVGKNFYSTYFIVVLYMLLQKGIVKLREKNPEHEMYEEYVIKVGEQINQKKKGFDDYIEKQYYIDVDSYEYFKNELSKEENMFLNKMMLHKNDIFKYNSAIAELENELKLYFLSKYSSDYEIQVFKYFFIVVFIAIITIIFVFGISGGSIFSEMPILIGMGLLFFITLANALSVKRYTKLYNEEYPKAKGFEIFLQKTETDRIKNFTTEDDVIRYFRQILPFAIAYGLENQYLKMLDNVISKLSLNTERVHNYLYYSHINNRMYYDRMINKSISETVNNSKRHGGSSTFSGGFSSSGSSGGGFGGGGGRSW